MNGRETRDLTTDKELIEKVRRGVDAVGDVVSSTMGPRGRTVILERTYLQPEVTKDGVTAAREIFLEDSVENSAAQLVKSASIETNDATGDGSSTVTLLTQMIYRKASAAVLSGANPVAISNGIRASVAKAVGHLRGLSKPVAGADLERVAIVSANDAGIGATVYEAVKEDPSKVVTVETSDTLETTVSRDEGARIPNGFLSPYFVTNPEDFSCEMSDPLIMFHDGKIVAQAQVVPALTLAAKSGRGLLVVAEAVEDQALGNLVHNRIKSEGALRVCAVKFAAFGNHKAEVLSDLAVICGGKVFGPSGADVTKPDVSDFGTCRKLTVTQDRTTFVGGAGSQEAIDGRLKELRAQIDAAEAKYDEGRLKERYARVHGGITVIRVGGATETEVNEKKQRVEDAIQATQAAAEEGVLPGGGTALAYVAELMSKDSGENDVVRTALCAPLIKILQNAGWDEERIEEAELRARREFGKGVNVVAGQDADMVEDGVLDPTKVTVTALQNAGSIAAALIGSSFAVTFRKKGTPKDAADYLNQ